MSRIQSINSFVMNFINDASDILSPEQTQKLLAKWKKATPELKKEMKPKTAEQKAALIEAGEVKPKHFKSAYIFYCQAQRPTVKRTNPEASPKEIISILSEKWNNLSNTGKAPFETQAKADRVRYDNEIAVYYEGHPNEVPAKKQKEKKKPTTAYQVFYQETREMLKSEGLTGKDLQQSIFARWNEVKNNPEQLQHYKDLLNEISGEEPVVNGPDQSVDNNDEPQHSEEEVETQDTEETPAVNTTKDDKRRNNIKTKLRKIVKELSENNDTVSLNMIKEAVKEHKYRISKEMIKELVTEIINEEDDQEENI